MYIDFLRFVRPFENESYLTGIPAVRWLMENEKLDFISPVTFIVGENGTGKSTLIEALAIASGFSPEGGTFNIGFRTEDSHSELWEHVRIGRNRKARDGFFLRAESMYNFASHIDRSDRSPDSGGKIIDYYGGKSLHKQSHGESFLTVIQKRLGGRGLYIFDEPEAALSPSRLLTLVKEIDRLVRSDSQLIISTHSPILMAYPGADILELSANGIRSVDYKTTGHYLITKRFINDPENTVRRLLEED